MKAYRQKQRPKKSSLISGRKNILKSIEDGEAIDRIYIDNKATGDEIRDIRQLATRHNIPINYVPLAKLNAFNVNDHGGTIAQKARIKYQDLQNIISFVIEKGETPLFLMLDGITDVRNIGGIARTAYCTGVHAIIIPDKGVGALNEDAILTSAGALEKIAVCRVKSLMKAVDDLHMNGIRVFASDMEAKTSIYDCVFMEPLAIVMGSEDKGIYPALLKVCDDQFSIPMKNEFESLNVSVATGMILYEVMKQRTP